MNDGNTILDNYTETWYSSGMFAVHDRFAPKRGTKVTVYISERKEGPVKPKGKKTNVIDNN